MAATYVKPGELGLNPEKLTEMLTELEQTVEIHSISVRFDGKVILEGAWEPFSLEKPQMMHSLSKSEQVFVWDLHSMRGRFIWKINCLIM